MPDRASTLPPSPPRDRRTGHVCASCGARFSARPGDNHLAAVYCEACLSRPDDPATAEHYWDLGGGD
ncbi:MAG TPA: hypothetical protein VM734_13945 [Kofleriaceae bacterium]|jgi:hypothetical protein|nr:hypothetical protein [Kofleriaceae bacterium]